MKDQRVKLSDYPSNRMLFFTSIMLLIIGDLAQAFMSSIDVADFFRYIVIGFVALMVVTSFGVILARFIFWSKSKLNTTSNT